MGSPDKRSIPSGDRRGVALSRVAETVAGKIAWVIRLLGLSRFDLAYATGRMPHEQKMATIEVYGREVIPRVRNLLAEPPVDPLPVGTHAVAGT